MNELNTRALILWVRHRDTSKHGPMTPAGVLRARKRLMRMGPDEVQMSSVEQSIHYDWQGLFPPRGEFAVQIDPATVELS